MTQNMIKTWGKHLAAIAILLVITIAYFSPAVLDGKVIQQGDMLKADGMGNSQMKQYEETAEPGEFSAWSDAMFGGMPYVSGYGNPAPDLPKYKWIESPMKSLGYSNAGMVLVGLLSFYLLMCVMGASWWLALGGAIAFALASYNIIIIEAGHITKAYVIAYMPVTLAGLALLFKKKYLWGAVLSLLGVALSINNSHPQITYYLMLLCIFIYAGFIVAKAKEKDWKEVGKVTVLVVACTILAILPGAKNLYSMWDLSKHSIRGASELTVNPDNSQKEVSTGLDKDYAFAWSYGKSELLTLLVPNAYGGGSGGTLDKDSEFYKAAKAAGAQVGKEIQAPTYWGDKSFTSGPVYFGAVVCFLFVLGMFVVRNPMKWWLFAGAAFLTLLALGRNMDWFNDFMFHNLPMYNKFRTVEMALVIPGLVAPLIGFWGLKCILDGEVDAKKMKQGLIGALAITGGLSFILWLMPTLLLSFQSDYDSYYRLPEQFYAALVADRKALASADALRSLLFILATAALVFWYFKAENKKMVGTVMSVGVAILVLADLWTVDRRYLNDSNYVRPQKIKEHFTETVADKAILQDKSNFRVLNLNNPFLETNTSYYHHSIGGYHAAKLRRYQELIDHRLQMEIDSIIGAFQTAKTLGDFDRAFAACPSLNMLNTRYIIYNPEQPPLLNQSAYGNAWFVSNVEMVENADAEIAALDRIDPRHTAVVDKRFASLLQGFTPQADSTASIELESYRPNRLVYLTHAASEQLAVFSEIYYQPGWKATIDGKPAEHLRADWILRAMRIPAGEHEVVFEFRPSGYVMAANVEAYSSFLILLMVIGAAGYSLWKAIRKP